MSEPELKPGDYCHAHRWSDKDPCDPWAVGFLKVIHVMKTRTYYELEGDGVPDRWFPHCEKITPEEGRKLIGRPGYPFPMVAPSQEQEQQL